MKLSILLPTYNDHPLPLATALSQQIAALQGVDAELIVADDCSTDAACRAETATAEQLPGCRLVWGERNVGRAAIRNRLADEAQGEWLLFIDADLRVDDEAFLRRYLEAMTPEAQVVVGGYRIQGDASRLKGNLRYLVERRAEPHKSLHARQRRPYAHFHTANVAVRRAVFQRVRFNEQMRRYGFEDVLFGRQLQQAAIPILHIDNPVLFCHFESNADFLRKTDESIQTQRDFAALIGDHSQLLRTAQRLQRLHLAPLLRLWHSLFGALERRWLSGPHPSVWMFQLYKLGAGLTPNPSPRGEGNFRRDQIQKVML